MIPILHISIARLVVVKFCSFLIIQLIAQAAKHLHLLLDRCLAQPIDIKESGESIPIWCWHRFIIAELPGKRRWQRCFPVFAGQIAVIAVIMARPEVEATRQELAFNIMLGREKKE